LNITIGNKLFYDAAIFYDIGFRLVLFISKCRKFNNIVRKLINRLLTIRTWRVRRLHIKEEKVKDNLSYINKSNNIC